MQDFSLDEVFIAIKIHPEEALLPEIWNRIISKFMKDGEVPDYCWYRSKNRQWLYLFNRNELEPKLTENRFFRMIGDLQVGIGRFSEWGYALRNEKKGFIVACSVSGFGKKAKVTDSRVGKVDRSGERLAVAEVPATGEQAKKLTESMF